MAAVDEKIGPRRSSRARKSNTILTYEDDCVEDYCDENDGKTASNKKIGKRYDKFHKSKKFKQKIKNLHNGTSVVNNDAKQKFFPIFTTLSSNLNEKNSLKRKVDEESNNEVVDENLVKSVDEEVEITRQAKIRKTNSLNNSVTYCAITNSDNDVKAENSNSDNDVKAENSNPEYSSNSKSNQEPNASKLYPIFSFRKEVNCELSSNHNTSSFPLESKESSVINGVQNSKNKTLSNNENFSSEEIVELNEPVKISKRERKPKTSSSGAKTNETLRLNKSRQKSKKERKSKDPHDVSQSPNEKIKQGRKSRISNNAATSSCEVFPDLHLPDKKLKHERKLKSLGSNDRNQNNNDHISDTSIVHVRRSCRIARSISNSTKSDEDKKNVSLMVSKQKKISEINKNQRKCHKNSILNQANQLKLRAKLRLNVKKEKVKNTTKLFPLFLSSPKSKDDISSSSIKKAKNSIKNKISSNKSTSDNSKINNLISNVTVNSEKKCKKNSSKKIDLTSDNAIVLNDSSNSTSIDAIDLNDSSNSIKDITEECKETINGSKDEKNIEKIKKILSYPKSKFMNEILSFPLFTQHHLLNYEIEDGLDSKFKTELTSDVLYPEWNGNAGLTDLKTFHDNLICADNHLSEVLPTLKNQFHCSEQSENHDLLWTDITNEHILKSTINETSIQDIKEWLLCWKSKYTKNNSNFKSGRDERFDSSSDSCDSEFDSFSNCLIIVGDPGTGKTSLVFSLANELGFKVLEVNASSNRSGRNISQQLKEALDSYHVENIKIDCNASKSPIKEPPKNKMVVKLDGIDNKEHSSAKKVKGIFNFFKPAIESNKKLQDSPKTAKSYQIDKIDKSSEKNNSNNIPADFAYKISSQTIILFDDIDVVFEEDEGFWSTVKNFLKISKKPFIFTVSRNLSTVKANLCADIKIINLSPMLCDSIVKNLENQCELNARKLDSIDLPLLASWNANDIRRSLLHAQFWTKSLIKKDELEKHGSKNENTSFSTTEFQNKTFLQSSLDFSPQIIKECVFKEQPQVSCNFISSLHSTGFDLLHYNLFSLFNVLNETKLKKEWKNASSSKNNGFYDPEPKQSLWQEACATFERKKKILKAGSHSDPLFQISSVLDNFSYSDCLKGQFLKNMNWLSYPERIHKWSSGLPVCSEDDYSVHHSKTLEIISFIQLLSLRSVDKKLFFTVNSAENEIKRLFLEHPLYYMDDLKSSLEDLALVLPTTQYLNKNILNLDYLSALKIMCHHEIMRQSLSNKRSNRFLHYFDSISLYIDKFNIETL